MILISTTTKLLPQVQAIINSEYRLNELVCVIGGDSALADIIVNEDVVLLPVWNNSLPPVLFPIERITDETIRGFVYARLGNTEKAKIHVADNPSVIAVLDLIDCLRNGTPINREQIDIVNNYASMHNRAVAYHYGNIGVENSVHHLINFYDELLNIEADNSLKAFSARQFALLLLDLGKPDYAIEVAQSLLNQAVGETAENVLNFVICNAELQQLKPPYEGEGFETLKNKLWQCLQFFETYHFDIETAEAYSDASHIALVTKSYSEALGYISKAIDIYNKNELVEMAAQAQLRKGQLLQTWAQHDNPQFYRSAVQAYQEALKVFTREDAPEIFADIHHQLGIIYADIPDEIKKKGIWASVAVSSFNEALNYYNKVDAPYEFARICNNMGLAYTKFPNALNSDNFDKAVAWYREALDVFTATHYPAERSATLLNYIDASWFVGNDNENRVEEMNEMVNEVLAICTDDTILVQAKVHLQKLQELKATLNSIE